MLIGCWKLCVITVGYMNEKQPKKPAKERLMFKIIKGGLTPADSYTIERLREKNYRVNDIVLVSISKCRNPAFNRLAHRIGQLVVANLDDFSGMDAHKALKRLQLEADAGCEELALNIKTPAWAMIKPILPAIKILIEFLSKAIGLEINDDGMVVVRVPRSMSFESMDEGEFFEVVRKICNHIAEKYWPEMTGERVEIMAESFVEAA